jgi:hypothetical protein
VRDIIGAELEEFSQKVCISFKRDGTMCAVVCVRDTETGEVLKFEREMNLRPAIDYVAKQLADWHVQQHGEASVSGWADFVKSAAGTVKRAATNKTVKSLYKQARPFIKYVPVVGPYADTSIDLATKAAKVYEKAKGGNKTAVAAVKKIKEMANKGDAKAGFAVKVMKNVGTLLKQRAQGITQPLLPQVAAQVPALRKQYGSLFKMGITSVSGNVDLIGNPIYDIIAGEDLQLVGEELELIGRRMSPHRRRMYAKARLRALKKQRQQQSRFMPPPGMRRRPTRPALEEQYYPVPPGLAAKAVDMGPPNETTTPDLPSDEYYPEPEAEYDQVEDETVQGWLWNRGYRDSSTMLAQMQKSPGLGMAAREVYNRGLGRPAINLDSLAAAAIKEF